MAYATTYFNWIFVNMVLVPQAIFWFSLHFQLEIMIFGCKHLKFFACGAHLDVKFQSKWAKYEAVGQTFDRRVNFTSHFDPQPPTFDDRVSLAALDGFDALEHSQKVGKEIPRIFPKLE